MDTIQKAVLIAHTLIALAIIALVLLQRGKGADAGANFGGGASGTVFGARGSGSFFSRATAICATLFFVSSLTLAYLSSQRTAEATSIVGDAPVEEAAPAPASDLPSIEVDDVLQQGEDAMPAIEEAADEIEAAADEVADENQ